MGRSRKTGAARVATLVAALTLIAAVAGPTQPVRAADVGYRDFSYSASGVSAPTGQKPQSKLWFAGGAWWGALFSRAADSYTVHELDWATQKWRDTGVVLEPRNNTYLDVLFDGSRLYVASAGTTTSSADSLQVRRLSWNAATRTYALDSGFPVTVVSGGMEAAVIDKDSTGAVWATWTRGGSVYVAHTTTDDRTWTAPFVVPSVGASNLTSDDISSVVAFDGKIGVMWSNQNDWAMYFAIHVDGAPDTEWTQNPAIQGPEYADDHMNLKSLQADTEGRVYAVTKTSLNAAAAPLILVLVLDRQGSWKRNTFGTVGDDHTRPLLLIDQQNQQLYVFAASPCCSGGTIYYKQSPLSNISFPSGKGTPFIQSSLDSKINNPASTKQPLDASTGLVVIAGDDGTKFYLHNAISLGADEQPPETTITSAPADGSSPQQATFQFTSSEPGSTFACRLDAGTWAGCASPASYPGITEGPHVFEVRATDAAGNTDATPASHAWTVAPAGTSGTDVLLPVADSWVDQAAPNTNHGADTLLDSDAGTGIEKDALVRFDTTSLPGAVTAARLRIYVTNGTGNGPPVYPVAGSWTESTVTWNTKPAVTGPAGVDATTIPVNAWYEYDVTSLVTAGTQVDLALIPQSTDGLNFSSREGSNPPQLVVDWAASSGGGDTTPPDTSIVSGPSGPTASSQATFSFSANEPSTFECRLDGAAWAGCTTPVTLTGLAEGAHTFDVRAIDDAGNVDATPASRSWTVDVTAPTAGATSPVAGATDVALDAVVTVQLSEAVDPATVTSSTFTLTPDGGSPVAASVTYNAATRMATLDPAAALDPLTAHAAAVSGITDLAGNAIVPATWSFTTAAAPTAVTVAASADAFVDERRSTRNYGTATTLTSDAGTGVRKEALVRFDVGGVTGVVSSARLRLWVTNGSANGPELYLADSTWDENAVTWATRPARIGGQVADVGRIGSNTWVEYDVTAIVTGDGTYTFNLASISTDATSVSSREAAAAPQLVVEWLAPAP